MAYLFGAHTRDAGGIDMAVRRAAAAGMRTMQFFSAKPQFYGDAVTVRAERIERFASAAREVGFDRTTALVHAAYVLNTASPEPDKYARSKAALARELERCTSLGVLGCCFHPGSAGSGEPMQAIERIAEAITHAIESVPGTARVLVENTAGGGKTMGRTAEEVGAILKLVPAKLRGRTGYGLDTCHLYASGHDIAKSRDQTVAIVDAFCDAAGEPPSFFHLNDSEGAMGSNRDRHALLGDGCIGTEPFRWLLADPRCQDVPLVLETPQSEEVIADDDPTPDPNDVRMMRLLEGLI